jgi:hypothetical protein
VQVDGVGERTFHCTAIAGDVRTIEVATPVLVALAPGPSGTVEAVAVQPTGG